MRALIGRRLPDRDPAPSRLAYRLTRFWLSPVTRRLVIIVLPVAALAGVAGLHVSQPATQARLTAWAGELRAQIEARPEFQIRQMKITGASDGLATAIRGSLALDFPLSWFHVDPANLRERVNAFDAVASAEVTVDLGGALSVRVTERKPAALWRHAGGLEIVDGTGHRIAFIDRRDGRPNLPLITGVGADDAVPEALALVEAAAPVRPRLRALTRRGERRWDVVLDRGQIIKLPEDHAVAAFERALAMDDARDLLARDITVIDMRLPERPTVRLGGKAMEYLRMTRAFEEDLKAQ